MGVVGNGRAHRVHDVPAAVEALTVAPPTSAGLIEHPSSRCRRALLLGRIGLAPFLKLRRAGHGVRSSPAPTRGAGSSSRTRNTPPAASALDPTHHRATKALASVGSTK